jgi:hypothetical protein
MTLLTTFDNLRNVAQSRINASITQVPSVSSTQFDWRNYKFVTEQIRYGHIEYFKSTNNKVEVVHVMCYPQLHVAYPIFGFDVIALNGVVTGVFCDVTPAPHDNTDLRNMLHTYSHYYKAHNRKLPEWAGFFSDQFLALAPEDNLSDIISTCLNLFEKYLYFIFRNPVILSKSKLSAHKAAQNKYSKFQQQNTKTLKALTAYIGESEAKRFIEKILFPVID